MKQKWDELTDDQLAGQVQKAYGVSRDEAEKQIKEFEKQKH